MLPFLCPAMMDLIVFLVPSAVSYSIGDRHLPLLQCAWLNGICLFTYMLTSLAVGWILSRRNARVLLLASTAITVLSGAGGLFCRAFWPTFAWMALFGVAIAFFFNSFQTFMRGEAPPGGLARVTALYTLSWSAGAGLGFLTSGIFYAWGPRMLIAIASALGAIVFLLLARHRARPETERSAEEDIDEGPPGSRPVRPIYVWIAWLIIFTAMFVQRPLQTLLPAIAGQQGTSALMANLPVALHLWSQAACGLACLLCRRWLYRRLPLLLFQLAAAAVFLLLFLVPSLPVLLIAMPVLGIWAGFAYFCAVFYAGNSGQRSRNIGINECLVGMGSVAGLFLSERCIAWTGNNATMFAVCAGALAISALVQGALATWRK